MTESVETPKPSAKRQIAATVTSVTVTVALGVAANVLIAKISKKVHDKIAPEEE
jgi:phenylpyruvate tautomerase PptA (4-oxalocrotonate tautomerase family)